MAIVSGGLGDIGWAIAQAFARGGAHVALGDLHDEGTEAVAEIEALDVGARYDRIDVSDHAAVCGWYDAVTDDLGLPSIIVPNAAVVRSGSWASITPDDWRRQLEVNLSGAFFTAQEGARRLIEAGEAGRIVFVGSWAADRPDAAIIPYCVSKAGLRMLMRCLAKELAPHDILVNEVAPGFVDAGVSANIFRERPGAREACVERAPVARLIEVDEVAAQVLHLCDPANRHMAGSTLLMDGGNSL